MTPKEIRIYLGLTPSQMAHALGIHRNTWGKWEYGKQRPPAVAITAMSMLVFIHLHELMSKWNP